MIGLYLAAGLPVSSNLRTQLFSHCFRPLGLRKNHRWKGTEMKKVSPSAAGWHSWIPKKPSADDSASISGTYSVPWRQEARKVALPDRPRH